MTVRRNCFFFQNVYVFLPPSPACNAAPEAIQPGFPGAMQPEFPSMIQPGFPDMIQPGFPGAMQPDYPEIIQPECPGITQPQYPEMTQPGYPETTLPEYPEIIQPEYPEMNLPETPQPPSDSLPSQIEADIFNLVNRERANHGLPPLRSNNALSNVARRKSQNMGDLGYFTHTAPDGTTTFDWLKSEGHSFSAWGENIADYGANATAAEIMNGWMNSPGHRANILSDNFTLLGVGVYQINNRQFATQVFGR